MKYIVSSLTLFLVFFTLCNAQSVSLQEAKTVAKNIISERAPETQKSLSFELWDNYTIFSSDNTTPAMYVFENKTLPGFIVIAADKKIFPVLAYSFESVYFSDDMPPAFKFWMSERIAQCSKAIHSNFVPEQSIKTEWSKYLTLNTNKNQQSLIVVQPLLKTKWNQGCYYNDLCPTDPEAMDGACGRVWTGCVATAMGQVLKYHNYPAQGQGSSMYSHPKYGQLSANYGNTTYNWDVMENSLNAPGQDQEVARLLFHCGVSVQMGYGTDGSGAQTNDAAYSFIEYFKYQPTLSMLDKDLMSETSWADALKEELLADRPVLYKGVSQSEGGHAWVCDGFEGSNHFHFDLGWGGAANGYYYLNNIAGFNTSQGGILGAEPKYDGPQYCNSSTHLTAPSGTIVDGSGDNRYANLTSCKWLIQPENAEAVVLQITSIKTETGSDRILIFDGTNENAPLLGEVSGYNLPSTPFVSSTGSMFVWFSSDEMNTSAGWEANYHSWMTGINDIQPGNFRIYPVPADDNLNIESLTQWKNPVQAEIISVIGNEVLLNTQVNIDGYKATIDISNLPSGMYYLQLNSGNTQTEKKKFIKL